MSKIKINQEVVDELELKGGVIMELCNNCKKEICELSGWCDCYKQVKYIIECYDCGGTYEHCDMELLPDETTIYTKGTCDDCFEWEVENLK